MSRYMILLAAFLLFLSGCRAESASTLIRSEASAPASQTAPETTAGEENPALPPERSGVLAQYTEEEKVGLVDQDTQEIVTPAIYARIDPFSEGLAAAYTEKEIHYLDEQGAVAITLERIAPTMQAEPFDSGLAKVWLRLDEDIPGFEEFSKHPFAILSGLIDTNGTYILPLEYQTHDHWSDQGTLWVKHGTDGSLWGMINRQGEFVLQPAFESVDSSYYPLELTPVKMNGKWGYLNEAAEIVIEPAFDQAGRFGELSGEEYEDKAVVSDIYLVASPVDELELYHESMGGYIPMQVWHRFIIDKEGNVVSDEGLLHVARSRLNHDTGAIHHTEQTYRLPAEEDDPDHLDEISFAGMAVHPYTSGYMNARQDEAGNWYLTEEYPSLWAVLVEEIVLE